MFMIFLSDLNKWDILHGMVYGLRIVRKEPGPAQYMFDINK